MAMKSGMVAAEAVFEHLFKENAGAEATSTPNKFKNRGYGTSCIGSATSGRPLSGVCGGASLRGIDTYVFKGQSTVWTLHHHEDHNQLGDKMLTQRSAIRSRMARSLSTACHLFSLGNKPRENQQTHHD